MLSLVFRGLVAGLLGSASVLGTVSLTRAAPNECSGAGALCAGAASVDMTWHTGSGQGQYGSAGNGLTSDKFDPFHHQTKMVPSDGMQSRLYTKAIVVKGADGQKVAYAKTELYLQQDLLTRRVAELVSGADPAVRDYVVPGLDGSRIMLGATHNHSAPEYVSTAWGVWLFTDSFDFRAFETTARKIAQSIKAADDALVPAKIGASVTRFGDVQQNILGPAVADDGTPAGFPRDHFDRELTVIRFDSLSGDSIGAWVNLGMHPESMDTFDLMSADFVGMVERLIERGMGRRPGADAGPVVAWSQGSVGDVEPDRESRAHPASEKREYWHRDISQAERMSRDLAAAVLDTWRDVAAGTPGVAEKFVPMSSEVQIGMVDYRFSGPVSHPLPTVSNCRTQRPGVPVIGLPDCERVGSPPQQYGATIDMLRGAGVPIPNNIGTAPSYAAVQESLTIHLQAMRLGDILVASCPCEPISDMVINFKSRADTIADDIYTGYHWECRPRANPESSFANECNFRRASFLPEDWRPVRDAAHALMLAQIDNDAAGWEEDFARLQGESEPQDPAEIKGNYTHQEIQDLSADGYRLPIMVGQANDYVGYIVTYREFMRGDHYRKALTAFGPHTSDYVNTRLVKMGAQLRGGPEVPGGVLAPAATADGLLQTSKALAVGQGASVGLGAYEEAIPDDGGAPGTVISQPASLQRFGAATLTWEGGSNWTDNPQVVVERRGGGEWETFATQDGGEVVVTLEYESPSPDAALDWLSGGKVYRWTATFEAFDETPPGSYRFVVEGHHRAGRTANPYRVESAPFDVSVWEGIAAQDLTVDLSSRTARFLADGFELTKPEAELETDEDGVLAGNEVHYPETYASPLAYIE
ncbi:MAG: neutral/alkaline non-lysosomal ceramidase N-terminal domain-containing protein, partial [Actinomycetota bacterium]